MDKFSDACGFFGITISQKKTQVMEKATPAQPCITVNEEELEVVHQFQYLGSTTTDTLLLDVELSKHIGKALITLSKLTKRVWENKHLTIPTKINVCKACVISILLYGGESWSTYSTQEWKLQVFHLECVHRILGITWGKTMTFSQELVFHPCSHSHINAIYTGWVMFTGWKMSASLRIYSMVSLPLGLCVEAAPNYASRMYASMT